MPKRSREMDSFDDPSVASPLIIIGASARAAAQSSIRAGYEPWCVDLFADTDLAKVATVTRCPADQYPEGLVEIIRNAPLHAEVPVLYTGALENSPHTIKQIETLHPLLGCSSEAIQRVRDPTVLPMLPAHAGLQFCDTRSSALKGFRDPTQSSDTYLIKPYKSGCGAGIHRWSGGAIGQTHYIQQFVIGTPTSAVYVSNIGGVRLFGVTEQMIGDETFGVSGFRYCGSVGPYAITDAQHAAFTHIGNMLFGRFGLRGPFGVDAVIDHKGEVWPVEVNPRYTSSVEVLEQATGLSVLKACEKLGTESVTHHCGDTEADDAKMPVPISSPAAGNFTDGIQTNHSDQFGKAIVFAKCDCQVGHLMSWFEPKQVADVPQRDQFIRKGRPICTLLASAPDRDTLFAHLRDQVETLYSRLKPTP